MIVAEWTLAALWAIAVGVLVRYFVRPTTGPAIDPLPENWGDTLDNIQWDREALAATHTALAGVRGTAEKWAATITFVLGLFGTVAFIKGPDAFTKLSTDTGLVVVALILVAAAAAGTAAIEAALAAQGTPVMADNWNGWVMRQLEWIQANNAMKQLRLSRSLAVVAAISLVTAMGIAWLNTIDQGASAEPIHALVVSSDGRAVCGDLTRNGGSLQLTTPSSSPVPLSDVTSVTLVDACP
jgi:hypothetical protein